MTTPTIRVVIADDHPFIRRGLREALDLHDDLSVVAEAENGPGALDSVRRLTASGQPPHVLVTDVTMPGFDGFELLSRVRVEHPDVAVVMLSVHPESEIAMAALRAGALGYVEKGAAADCIVEAVRRVASGRRYTSDALADQITAAALDPQGAGRPTLAPREIQVVRAIAEGLAREDIAHAIGVAPATVTTFRTRACRKLGLRTDAELTRYAFSTGIAEAPYPGCGT